MHKIYPRTYPISNSDVCPIRFVGDVDIFPTELSLLWAFPIYRAKQKMNHILKYSWIGYF